VPFIMVFELYKAIQWRQARIKRKDDEVFRLVRQATNFMFQQHQMGEGEGKGGPINFNRDQLIPPQDRVAKLSYFLEPEQMIFCNQVNNFFLLGILTYTILISNVFSLLNMFCG
jgi:hypothetical protein